MNSYLAASLGSVLFLIGVGVGYYLTPEYSQGNSNLMMSGSTQNSKLSDREYVNRMIAHHLSAIAMAETAKRESRREEVVSLSGTIITVDTEGIAELYEMKKQLFNDTKKVPSPIFANLGIFDERFDLRFINALIAHHEEAIEMAIAVRQRSTANEILTLADEVITSLTPGITMLINWRQEWYGI